MKLPALILLSSAVILTSYAEAQKAYYQRRAYPQKYYYGQKSVYNAGPPINKYRPPGYRLTRNPYIGPGPSQGLQYQPQGVSQGVYQGAPQGGAQVYHQVPQGLPQGIHQHGVPQNIHPGIHQNVHQGPPQHVHPGVPQGIPQGVRHVPIQGAPHLGHPHQQVPHSQLQSLPKRLTPAPPTHLKPAVNPQFTSAAPLKYQPSHLNSINEAPSFTAATKTYYKPDDDRSPIHTIPAPNLSAADKPADFDYKVQQLTAQQQRAQQQQYTVAQQQSTPQQQQSTQQQFTQQPYLTTPSFKTLDNAIANQIKINPASFLTPQTQPHFAPDPDPQHVPQVRIPPSGDPFSQPSNGQVPIDIYLQQQVDNEIAQQEALYLQQQRAQYQQQVQAAELLAAQQAYQAQQENIRQQQQYQQQAMLQQAMLQQQQYQEVPVQGQSSESLTAEELYNLMNGISPTPPSTQSVQNVLATPQQQNEISGAATTNFQPNYQSFNYDEKAHQEQSQIEQERNTEVPEVKRASESSSQVNFSPQYENFNYDEKTKRNGFNNEGNDVEQQVQVNDVTHNTNKNEAKDKKEKRFQKNAFNTNSGQTVGYSTLPREIIEGFPQDQQYNKYQGYSSMPTNLNLPPSRNVKPEDSSVNEIKKTHLKKKVKRPNNGYSTIAEDLLQQHDMKKDLQQLTYSTLPNKKIIEVLKHQRQLNSTQQLQEHQTVTTEKDPLQKMRENAQKFYNPHILQAARNNTSNGNFHIQESIQIYENNYSSKGDDNHIDLSGITTTSTTTVATTADNTTEPAVVTEINVIESDSDHQESNLYEEIMLQDESKPLEDTYHSNSHSYFGQRIRPKRT